jgi:hypothetical protein
LKPIEADSVAQLKRLTLTDENQRTRASLRSELHFDALESSTSCWIEHFTSPSLILNAREQACEHVKWCMSLGDEPASPFDEYLALNQGQPRPSARFLLLLFLELFTVAGVVLS